MLTRLNKWLGLHVHDWTKWEQSGDIVSTVHKGVIGTVQSRSCKDCGYRESRKIWLG